MKRKSFLQTAVMLFTLFGLSLSTARAQEVQVTIIPRMDPMPPQVMSYISQPGVFFNVTLNNTSTEALNVFLTLEVEQMTNGELHVITPYYIQPMNPIVLAPNTPTPVTSVALQNQFRQLETTDVVLRGGQLSDFYGTGIVGLLPEGMYRAYIKVYKWEPGVKYPQMLSNPTSGQCTFNVCYHAQAPEITMPFYQEFSGDLFTKKVSEEDLAEVGKKIAMAQEKVTKSTGAAVQKAKKNLTSLNNQYKAIQAALLNQQKSSGLQACVVDNLAASFAWTAPILNCGGTPKQYTYDFEVFPMGVAMSYPEQAVKAGTLALSLKGLTTTSCILTPEQVNQIQKFSYSGFFVARVTAKPRSSDKSNINYVAIENEGHSQLLVFKFKDTIIIDTSTDDDEYVDPYEKEEEEVVVETTPAISDDFYNDETITTDYVIFPPKLTSPDIKVRGILEENGKVELKWEEPEAKTVPTKAKSLNYTYDVKVYKRSSLQTVEQAMKGEPIIKKESLTALKYTVPWEDLKSKVKLNDNLVYAVTATCTNEESITVEEDKRNIYQQSYADLSDHGVGLADCYPENANNVSNKELAILNEKQIRDLEVMIGEFPMTITNANLSEDKTCYKGKGYISWYPFGKGGWPLMINVEFDALKINKENIVYEGQVKSCHEEDEALSEYIPYEIFDECNFSQFLSSGSVEALGNKVDEYIQNSSSMAQYYAYAQKGTKLIDDMIKNQVSVNLPVSLRKPLGDNGIRIDSSPIDIQILSATFSPTTASISVLGMLAIPESKYVGSDVAVFGAPQICIQPESFAPKGATIALLSDFTLIEPERNIIFNLKAPSDYVSLSDGCSITFTDDGLEQMTFEAQMTVPGLMKADDKGHVIENEDPAITVKAYIKDWDNWIGTVAMDNFQVEEASGFTFMVGGSGISYDHSSSKKISASFDLPKDDGAVQYNKDKAHVTSVESWQGLYVDKMAVLLPSFFDDEKGGSVEVGVRGLYYDGSGISLVASIQGSKSSPIVKAHTSKAGGWGISLETVNLNVISSDFGSTSIIGGIQAPIIGGEWEYKTSFSMAQNKKSAGESLDILFEMKPREDPSFDFFLAKLDLDDDYTHFKVHDFEGDTDVELQMAGKITIAGLESASKKIPLDFSISGIEFTGMRLANFAPEKKSEQSTAASKKFSYTFEPICEGEKRGDIWFDLGTWSLASPGKQLGPFDFTLDNFGINTNTEGGKALTGVNIVGSIGLLGQTFVATAGITVWAEINVSDIKNIKVKYAKTTLDEIGIHSEFGGCVVDGSLKFEETSKKKGYAGTLEFTLPGELFTMKAAGGFFNCTDSKGKFMSAYFEAEVGGASGIPMPPIQLNNISGGFYFNTSLSNTDGTDPLKWKKTEQRDVHGGMFGLGISTIGSDRGVNAKVKMIVVYDAAKNRLSTFRMNGKVHALCVAPQAEDGLINADCSIVYQNLPKADGGKFIQINITVDAGGDMDQMVEAFTGQKIEIPDITAGLEEMEDKSSSKNKDAKDTKAKVSCGVHLALDFKVTMRADDEPKGTKTKWHLWLGQPGDGSYESEQKNRCSITLIDFQVGGKDDAVAVWAKIWANAYLCIGNELPNNGQLPPIPQEIDEFLNGKDASGGKQALSGKANADRNKAVKDFDGAASSGVMFGAQAGGDFGVNAVICYARATLIAGFDIVLKQLAPGTTCNGKPAGGKGGFYGTGQVYALAKGELGLMINLWIFKGKLPLIDVGLGALLKGGFPNPSWAYGKVRAKCKLLGGLIKFNGSLTFDIGDVCYPDAGNPLDDIQIFGDMAPGSPEMSQGWTGKADDEISCYSTLGFTTNMTIDRRLDLVDVNKANQMAGRDGDPESYYGNCHRAYVFHLEPQADLYNFGKDKPKTNNITGRSPIKENYVSSNHEDFNLVISGGRLEAKSYYMLVMKGYAKEIVNGREQDPIFNDESTGYKDVSRPWTDEARTYFQTGSLPNDLNQDVALKFPTEGRAFNEDLAHPELHLKGSRVSEGDDIFNPVKYDIRARIEKKEHGKWVPADAKTRAIAKIDGNYYYVDADGNVDYMTQLNANGEVVNSQRDPFTTHLVPTITSGHTTTSAHIGPVFEATGLGQERLHRFVNTFDELMKDTKSAFTSKSNTASEYDKYGTLKWIPESYTSLEIAIDYYQQLLTVDQKKYPSLSSVKTKLSNLYTEIHKTYEKEKSGSGGHNGRLRNPLVPEDADIEFVDCPTTRGSGSSAQSSIDLVNKAYNEALALVDYGPMKDPVEFQQVTYNPSSGSGSSTSSTINKVVEHHTGSSAQMAANAALLNAYTSTVTVSTAGALAAMSNAMAAAVSETTVAQFSGALDQIMRKAPVHLTPEEAAKVADDVRDYHKQAYDEFFKVVETIYCTDASNAMKKKILALKVLSHEADSLADAVKQLKQLRFDVAGDKISVLGRIADGREYASPQHTMQQYYREMVVDSARAQKKYAESVKLYSHHDYAKDIALDMQAICDSINAYHRWMDNQVKEEGAKAAAADGRKAWEETQTYQKSSSYTSDTDQTRYNKLYLNRRRAESAYENAKSHSTTSRYTQEAKGYRDSIVNVIANDGTLAVCDAQRYTQQAVDYSKKVKDKMVEVGSAIQKVTQCQNNAENIVAAYTKLRDNRLGECYDLVDALLNTYYDISTEYRKYASIKTDYTYDELNRLSEAGRKQVEQAKQIKGAIATCKNYADDAQREYNDLLVVAQAQDNVWSVVVKSVGSAKNYIIDVLKKERGMSDSEAKSTVQKTPFVACSERSKAEATNLKEALIAEGAKAELQKRSVEMSASELGVDAYKVEITDIGQSKIQLIKAIKELTGMTLPESQSLIDNSKYPIVVLSDVTFSDATIAVEMLTEAGATARMKLLNASASPVDATSLTETGVAGLCNIVITDFGTQTTNIIKAIKEILGSNLREAKDIVDLEDLPYVLKSNVSVDEAKGMISKLEAAGATVAPISNAQGGASSSSQSASSSASSVSLPSSSSGLYDVVVTDYDSSRKLKLIQAIQDIAGLNLKESKTLVDGGVPITVKSGLSANDAKSAIVKLTEAGATASAQASATSMNGNFLEEEVGAPLYLATVPGVAEAFELMSESEPESEASPKARAKKNEGAKDTPDAPAKPIAPATPSVSGMPSSVAAGIISSVASGMNAKAAEAKPAASQPAPASVASVPSAPSVPSVPSIPAVPSEQVDEYTVYDNAYSAANKVLQSNYVNTSGTTSAWWGSSSSEIEYYVDAASVVNSKVLALPVTYHCGEKNGSYVRETKVDGKTNPRYHWITIDNVDLRDYINDDVTDFRIVIEQVDKDKEAEFIESQKKQEVQKENAKLEEENQFLSNKGTAETENTVNLEQYMANYYQEMQDDKLFTVTDTTETSKITNKKALTRDMFVQEIYSWYLGKVSSFGNFAEFAQSKLVSKDGGPDTSPSSYFQNEGFLPLEVNYGSSAYTSQNLVFTWDDNLYNQYYYMKYNPTVWLAYVGSYAFFNSLTVYDRTDFMEADITAPRSISLNYHPLNEFKDENGVEHHAYRRRTKGDVKYSLYTAGSSDYSAHSLLYLTGVLAETPDYRFYTRNYLHQARWWTAWEKVWSKTEQHMVDRVNTFSDDKMWTLADAMEEPLYAINKIMSETRSDWEYFKYYGRKDIRRTIQSRINSMMPTETYYSDAQKTKSYTMYTCADYQPLLLSLAHWQWQEGWKKDYNNTFWNYGQVNNVGEKRMSCIPLFIAGGYKAGGTNYKFDFDWYCNNVKSIKYRIFRANCYDTQLQCYDMDLNRASGFYYDFTQSNPLKGVADKYRLEDADY